MKAFSKPGNPYRKQCEHIRALWKLPDTELFGVERWFLLALAAILVLLPAMLVRLVGGWFGYLGRKLAIDGWAVAKPLMLSAILILGLAHRRCAFVLAILFLADLYAYLLGLVFLRRLYTAPASYGRSVLLLGINFLESMAAFSVLYLHTGSLARGGAAIKWGDAVYFSAITSTTVGYGDVLAVTDVGHLLAVLQALSSLLFVAVVLSTFVSNLSSDPKRSGAQS